MSTAQEYQEHYTGRRDRNLEAAQAYSLALERLEKVIESHPELFKDDGEAKE